MANHQASEQMIGYLYQVRYALYLLLDNDNTNYQISIEKFDDIAFEENGSPKELVQLKHHINSAGSLSDSSTDFWRTLKVWIDLVSADSNVLYSSDFFLITTSRAPSGSVAEMLSRKERDVNKAYNQLKQIAETSTNQSNEVFYKAFKDFEIAKAKCLLNHINIIANSDNIVDTETKIRKFIKYWCNSKQEDYIFERLEGWWLGQTIKALCIDEPVYFNQKEVRNLIATIRREYDDDNLPIDEDIRELDNILEEDLNPKQRIFLEQLRLLKLKNNHLNIALLDYYRAYQQRASWVRNDLLYTNDLISYERRLIDAWREAYTWMVDDIEEEGASEEEKIKAGKKLYRSLMDKDIRIRPNCSEPFIMKGSYHMLANDLKIGWHVDFVKRLQQLLVSSEGV